MTIYSSIYEKNTSYRPKGEINNFHFAWQSYQWFVKLAFDCPKLGPVVAQDSPNLDNRMSKATAERNGNSVA